jgi:hypothetical protein
LRPKTSRLLFGHLVWRFFLFLFFSIFIFWTGELHISQAFCRHQARPIPTPYEPVVKFCSKWVLSSFFLYFLRSSYMQPCGWHCPRPEGQGAKKEVCFAHRILDFTFFHFFFVHGSAWCQLQCDCYNLNVKFLIFSRNFTRSIVLTFWVKILINKKNFDSLIIINMELKFEPCLLNLISKWCAKDPKKERRPSIFH